jgi:hypothetical protein
MKLVNCFVQTKTISFNSFERKSICINQKRKLWLKRFPSAINRLLFTLNFKRKTSLEVESLNWLPKKVDHFVFPFLSTHFKNRLLWRNNRCKCFSMAESSQIKWPTSESSPFSTKTKRWINSVINNINFGFRWLRVFEVVYLTNFRWLMHWKSLFWCFEINLWIFKEIFTNVNFASVA